MASQTIFLDAEQAINILHYIWNNPPVAARVVEELEMIAYITWEREQDFTPSVVRATVIDGSHWGQQ
jgi:predicted alpha/beta superfamily hydrolase